MKSKVYLADLTHTGHGNPSLMFPLGVAFVASYGQEVLGDHFAFKVFKFPEPLARALMSDMPTILGLSNFCWNLELSCKLASWAKQLNPNLIIVMGGPNFPVAPQDKSQFLKARPMIDFHIESEGEVAFANLLRELQEYDFNVPKLKSHQKTINNLSYLDGQKLVAGGVQRILDVNILPSPYLNGMLDEFFELPLIPMLETTRGCPFSCSFCADGLPTKNKVERFDSARTKAELRYMAERVKYADELTITDLNFGMYKPDIATAGYIAEIQEEYHWPGLVKGAAGKNKPGTIMETATLLKGTWTLGSAIQSSDKDVLKNINRSNISLEAYQDFTDFMNDISDDATTYTELILALPGDTKATHFESLRYGIENNSTSLKMHQAMMLIGTEMASQETRNKYDLLTKYRISQGGVGVYQFGDQEVPVAELEEIIVGSKDMSIEDYVSCRIMNLFVEAYYNSDLCEEIFSTLKAMKLSVFDFLVYFHEHDELYSPKLKKILAEYVSATRDDLYDSHDEAEQAALHTELITSYLSGELGSNELLDHKALMYLDLDDSLSVLVEALKRYLVEKGMLNATAEQYLDQLKAFILCRKTNVQETGPGRESTFNYDFKAIEESGYRLDPRDLTPTKQGVRFRFYHDEDQVEHIQKAVSLYENNPGGFGRILQRHNVKSMYRQFERV